MNLIFFGNVPNRHQEKNHATLPAHPLSTVCG